MVSGILTAQEVHIKGITSDLPDGTLVKIRNIESTAPQDSVYVQGNKFQYTLKSGGEPERYILRVANMESTGYTFFFVEDTDIEIDLRDKKYVNYAKITGGKVQNQAAEFTQLLAENKNRYDSLKALQRKEQDTELRQKLSTEASTLYWKMLEDKMQFMKAHPDYEYVAFMLKELWWNKKNEEIQTHFDALTPAVKASKYGRLIANYLKLSKDLSKGDAVVNFELKNLEGQPVALDDYQGKYVFLDFWASWCGPCRKQHPGLAKLYKKYKAQGFEIVSVSMDYDDAKWRKAVEKDQMQWTNLIDSEGLEGDAAVSYKLVSIPTSFLIDPEGKFIARYTNGRHDLETQLASIFPE